MALKGPPTHKLWLKRSTLALQQSRTMALLTQNLIRTLLSKPQDPWKDLWARSPGYWRPDFWKWQRTAALHWHFVAYYFIIIIQFKIKNKKVIYFYFFFKSSKNKCNWIVTYRCTKVFNPLKAFGEIDWIWLFSMNLERVFKKKVKKLQVLRSSSRMR